MLSWYKRLYMTFYIYVKIILSSIYSDTPKHIKEKQEKDDADLKECYTNLRKMKWRDVWKRYR